MIKKIEPCPFCGGSIDILLCDDEGNIKNSDYKNNPYLTSLWYQITHNVVGFCPIATHDEEAVGRCRYYSQEDAINAWNKRYTETEMQNEKSPKELDVKNEQKHI